MPKVNWSLVLVDLIKSLGGVVKDLFFAFMVRRGTIKEIELKETKRELNELHTNVKIVTHINSLSDNTVSNSLRPQRRRRAPVKEQPIS